ncbi:MAG: hypothetical protein AB7O91_07190 [Sphingomonas sp.]
MRKILVSVALATATIAAAVPAAAEAQSHARSPYRPLLVSRADVNNLVRDLNRVDAGITRSLQRRIISPREAFGLRREANQVRVRLNWASRGGINGREFATLRGQVNRLEMRLRMERRDRDGRRG